MRTDSLEESRGWAPLAGCYGNLFIAPIDAVLARRIREAQLLDPRAPAELAVRVQSVLREYVDDVLGRAS